MGTGGTIATGGTVGTGGTIATGGTVGTGGTTAIGGTTGGGGSCGTPGKGPLAASSTFYQDISCAAVDSESSTIMQALQTSGWGNGLGIDISFTVLNADSSVPRRAFTNYGGEPDCDTAPVPLPPGGNVEGQARTITARMAATATCWCTRGRGSTSCTRRT